MIPRGGVPRGTPVYEITDVGASRDVDLASRQKWYALSMAIRTACFLGAVAATGWLRWVLVAGAFLLPYFAVVIANAGRERASVLPVALHSSAPQRPDSPGDTGTDDTPTRRG